MSKVRYTALPWKTFIRGKIVEVHPTAEGMPVIGWTGFDESATPLTTHRANARLIVRAVNNHHDLIITCKNLLARLEKVDPLPDGSSSPMRDFARATIAAATE